MYDFRLDGVLLPLNPFKYEPLPDSDDDEYSDEEFGDQESDAQEEDNSDNESSKKRRMSTEPKSRKRRRVDDEDVFSFASREGVNVFTNIYLVV
jgi:hypothetical protein